MSPIPYLLTLFLASATPIYSSQLNRRVSSSVSVNCKRDFAYTFDEGPSPHAEDIIDEFDCMASKATFFVNGNHQSCIYSEENVERLRYAFEAGHQIASHTWSNADLSTLTNAQIDVEIQRLDEALIKILGVKPKVFRPPNNSIPDSVADYITTKHGKTVVTSDSDSGDSSSGATAQSVFNFYQNLANEGKSHPHLTLAHETSSIALDAMDLGSVEKLVGAGIKLVTVAQCLDVSPYEVIGNYGIRDASWTCDGAWSPSTTPTCKQTYTASATDKTCATIAGKFGVTAQAIALANPFLNCQDVWQWTPVCIPAAVATTAVPCVQTYNAVAKDTCTSIAAKFGVTPENLFSANTFVTCNDIWARTPLCIPKSTIVVTVTCAKQYTSKAGDTCASIGTTNGLSADAIKNANTFLNCNDIWSGTPICIPPGGKTCESQYTAGDSETCTTVGAKFGLDATAIYNANTFVGCNDIWKGTPLCIPPGGRGCTNTIKSWPGATCNTIAGAYGTTAANIKLWNSFVDCNSIWTNTPLCVAH